MSINRLETALENLIQFLERNKSDHWANFLRDIQKKLQNPATIEEVRLDLNSCFGGMGSLNDLNFANDKLDSEFGKFSDEVFKENRLADAGALKRFRWRLYEFSHSGELPSRIKNAFASKYEEKAERNS